MKIIKVVDDEEKKKITRAILEALPEWFGIIEAREKYILDSVGKDFFCAIEKDKVVGFLYLKQTGKDTVELAVMGVLKEYHRKGIGRALFEYAKESIQESGYSFIQVKTVKMGMYEDYDCTNRFYNGAIIKFRRNYVSSYDERIYPLLSRENCWWYIR